MGAVTDDLRAELRAELARRRIKQTDLARELGVSRTHLSNMLNGQRGQLPATWERLLDHLGLELTVRAKAPD
jgi:predicted transcriptional regulator